MVYYGAIPRANIQRTSATRRRVVFALAGVGLVALALVAVIASEHEATEVELSPFLSTRDANLALAHLKLAGSPPAPALSPELQAMVKAATSDQLKQSAFVFSTNAAVSSHIKAEIEIAKKEAGLDTPAQPAAAAAK
mmetsp:Transcript_88079/g.132005  ORF Transcript_88079/g.132005 Transcript_88079/m.132005 type:complete len:137 (+) Transcript_88079:47-457(+)|eukprot:CAMPEP_0117045622 /NCGR_PEP_ID=MMETSP0472-20121206/31564_1 /TAXON_ID=693140 ORGANISM="Tiarina fusus, Strain LIS" /NCGR_SAMPLE_ID=MMETSP0472 /ASSEMBLY_ACC=CAM_ASM_000603 /LENGTH=136 /DNA_ID=CAMNT_0004757699 /DNA_START=40 /DNA_END=450 /DNA_ORIENTATION=+